MGYVLCWLFSVLGFLFLSAIHSLFKGLFVGWAFVSVYGYYDPQWRVNFLWWAEWSFLEPNPELVCFFFVRSFPIKKVYCFSGSGTKSTLGGLRLINWSIIVTSSHRVVSHIFTNISLVPKTKVNIGVRCFQSMMKFWTRSTGWRLVFREQNQ